MSQDTVTPCKQTQLAGVDWAFCCQLQALLACSLPRRLTVVLIALSLLESYAVARGAQQFHFHMRPKTFRILSGGPFVQPKCRVRGRNARVCCRSLAGGFVAGAFYRALVDGDAASFGSTLLLAAGLFSICTLLQATSRWLSEIIALGCERSPPQRWVNFTKACGMEAAWLRCRVRGVLARRMHALYLATHGYHGQIRLQPAPAGQSSPDNPDQRMTSDLSLLTQLLRRVMVEFGTAPYKIVFYSWWVWSYTGWLAVGVIYSFALLGTVLQRYG